MSLSKNSLLVCVCMWMAACSTQDASNPPDNKSPADVIDSDGDGVADSEDAFPNDASQSSDTDGDGIGDGVDPFPEQAGCLDGYFDTQSDGSVCDDIDECSSETDNCDALVACSNTEGSFTCGACPAGYSDANGDGTACVDIDECATEADDCDAVATCNNTQGSFECGACPAGYSDANGDGTACVDIDECATETDNCDALVACSNTQGGFECGACPEGYSNANGDGSVCADIDECATETDDCDVLAACSNTQGSFECGACPEGYRELDEEKVGRACAGLFAVGGSLTGLTGIGLALENNGGDRLMLSADGVFAFPEEIIETGRYDVAVAVQPTGQFCSVSMGSGIVGNAAITNISVVCQKFVADGLPSLASMTLTWSDVGAASYDVFYSTDEECDIASIGSCAGGTTVNLSGLTHTATSLANQEFYFVTVAANGSSGAPALAKVAVRPTMWGPDADVRSLFIADDGTRYIGGDFHQVGPITGGGVPLSLDSGLPRRRFPPVNGEIDAVITDGEGGWYIGGSFTHVGGEVRSNLAHILPNGAVDVWSPVVDDRVHALLLDSGVLYAGGNFNFVDGEQRGRLAAWDVSTHLLNSWTAMVNGAVNALAVSQGIVYFGGSFSLVRKDDVDNTRNNFAALDASGNLEPWDPDASGEIKDLVVVDNLIYAAGSFSTVGDKPRSRLAALNLTGQDAGNVTNLRVSSNGSFDAIVVVGNTIYVGGSFSSLGSGQSSFAAIDALSGSSGTIIDWDPDFAGRIYELAIDGNTLYVGGDFSKIGDISQRHLAAFDIPTKTLLDWDPKASHDVNALAVDADALYVGGSFASVGGGVQRQRLAALDAATGKATNWNPNLSNSASFINGTVRAISVSESMIYAGGDFDLADGIVRKHLAAWDRTTGTLSDWDPNLSNNSSPSSSSTVHALMASADTLYVGGRFTDVGTEKRNHIAAFDIATGALDSWDPNASGDVYAICLSHSAIYVGGGFNSIGGVSRSRLAALDLNDGNATSFATFSLDNTVKDVLFFDDNIYAAGDFKELIVPGVVFPVERNGLISFDLNGALNDWAPNADLPVRALGLVGDTIHVGGTFDTIGGANRTGLAALGAGDNEDEATTWVSGLDGDISAIAVSGSDMLVGGHFTSNDVYAGAIEQFLSVVDTTVSANE